MSVSEREGEREGGREGGRKGGREREGGREGEREREREREDKSIRCVCASMTCVYTFAFDTPLDEVHILIAGINLHRAN